MVQNKCLQVPIDCRLCVASLWLSALTLLVLDSLDGSASLLAAWAVIIALGATAWTAAALHSYSRRILLDVMSWEHRQQTPLMDEPDRSLTSLGL